MSRRSYWIADLLVGPVRARSVLEMVARSYVYPTAGGPFGGGRSCQSRWTVTVLVFADGAEVFADGKPLGRVTPGAETLRLLQRIGTTGGWPVTVADVTATPDRMAG